MSVLKANRTESKAEYVNTANQIFLQTVNYLSRMSARYSRLLAEPTMNLAAEVLDNVEKANSIYPSDEVRAKLREKHLLEARAALMALDVHLTHCTSILLQNPQGCFSTPNGKPVPPKKATEQLGKMQQQLGDLIDKEDNFIKAVLKNDRERLKKEEEKRENNFPEST